MSIDSGPAAEATFYTRRSAIWNIDFKDILQDIGLVLSKKSPSALERRLVSWSRSTRAAWHERWQQGRACRCGSAALAVASALRLHTYAQDPQWHSRVLPQAASRSRSVDSFECASMVSAVGTCHRAGACRPGDGVCVADARRAARTLRRRAMSLAVALCASAHSVGALCERVLQVCATRP